MAHKGLSVKALAREASTGKRKVSERTISRLRSGTGAGGVRLQTIRGAMPTSGARHAIGHPDGRNFQRRTQMPKLPLLETRWNIRLPTAIRNAYTLVAIRYRVSGARIVELAPLVFLLMAEQSLASRRQRLKEMREAYAARTELAWQARYLPLDAAFDAALEDIYEAEQASIDKRDLFAETLRHDGERLRAGELRMDYDKDEHNPFCRHPTVLRSHRR